MDPAFAQRRASGGSSFGLRRLAAAGVVATVRALLLWIGWRLVWAEPLEAQASSLRAELERQLEQFAWQRLQQTVWSRQTAYFVGLSASLIFFEGL
jgi:hypothetical protein